jgi:hypothetical protein
MTQNTIYKIRGNICNVKKKICMWIMQTTKMKRVCNAREIPLCIPHNRCNRVCVCVYVASSSHFQTEFPPKSLFVTFAKHIKRDMSEIAREERNKLLQNSALYSKELGHHRNWKRHLKNLTGKQHVINWRLPSPCVNTKGAKGSGRPRGHVRIKGKRSYAKPNMG